MKSRNALYGFLFYAVGPVNSSGLSSGRHPHRVFGHGDNRRHLHAYSAASTLVRLGDSAFGSGIGRDGTTAGKREQGCSIDDFVSVCFYQHSCFGTSGTALLYANFKRTFGFRCFLGLGRGSNSGKFLRGVSRPLLCLQQNAVRQTPPFLK